MNYPIHYADVEIDHGRQGIDLLRQTRLSYCLIGPPQACQQAAVMLTSSDVVRIEFDRAFEALFTSRPVPLVLNFTMPDGLRSARFGSSSTAFSGEPKSHHSRVRKA